MKKFLLFIVMFLALVSITSGQDSEPDYLCFEVDEGTEISLVIPNSSSTNNEYFFKEDVDIKYSYDKEQWIPLTKNKTITISNHCFIYFKGRNNCFYKIEDSKIYRVRFKVTKPYKCFGNIMTLIDETGETTELTEKYTFAYLFQNNPLITAPKLPATTLTENCYEGMFQSCYRLLKAPALPATTLADCCYFSMFDDCDKLMYPPELPAISLMRGCYSAMFRSCDNLSIPPELPATSLAKGCYNSMFANCHNLLITPELPATILAEGCYQSMFYHCDKLETTPMLPAKDYVSDSYKSMFSECTNLKYTAPIYSQYGVGNMYNMFTRCSKLQYISVRFVLWYGDGIKDWVKNVASNGIFVCPAGLLELHNESHIPEKWTVKRLSELTLYNINIPQESRNYIIIPYTTDIEASTEMSFYVKDRTSEGYTIEDVTVVGSGQNPIPLTNEGNIYKFTMPEEDVYIEVSYTSVSFSITVDNYSSTDKTTANVGDVINVTFKNRNGYNLTSATYNGTALTITNNAAQFTMPAANVTIATTHTPIEYNITAGEYVTVDKTKATINDQVSFTVADRKDDGYKLDKVLVNNTEFSGRSFNMADYLMDVTITAQYSKIGYTITTDDYSSTDKTTANVGNVVNITFKNRAGYNLTSATYNGTALTITNNAAQFTMPAANVTIATTYTKVDYTITADQYSTPNKTTANVGDEITVTFANRDGYNLTSATYNGNPLTITNNTSSFTMPAANVTIATTYTKIDYTITADQYSTPNKTTANVGDEITVTFANRDGYNLTSATYNGNPLTIINNTASFTMLAANVTIATTYTKIDYSITADQYSTPNKTKANVGDEITVTFANRDGYSLTSATYNGTALNVSNNTATFTMPAANVTIATTYTKVDYTITADQYSTPNKNKANVGDEITVTFANRDGYNLTSATYNGTALTITNGTSSFTMPAANVTIATTYTKVDYTITADQYSTPNKATANVGDEITVTFANRDGYNLTSATYNGTALNISNNTATFTMPAANVTIATTYTKIDYTITADQYSTPNKTTANVGDEITVTFANRDGYSLTSATYNGTALNITNNTAAFTMPSANVTIATTYTPIEYNITVGEYVTANKAKATLNDQVSFTLADRTADDYQLNKVLINNTEISGTSFNMADYLTDVTITAVYSKIGYTITSDVYSTPSKTKANVGDEITVTFSKRDGYNLTSATYNGTALTIVDYKSQFTMPDEDVEIKTVYTLEQQQITKPEIITDNNVEITLPENLTENTEVTFTVQQKPGFTAFVYVNGVLTNEYKFVFTGKVEIKVDYKELTVSNISAETESYCAGDEINLTFATNPYAVEYELTFSNEAQKEGFENIDFLPVASYEQQPASFKIPQSVKPGKYHAFIRVKDSKDSHSKQYAFDFEVLYPTDIIETKYSDLICVNNSKNEYIGYQWFKNNKEIKGADKQFYIDAPMLNGSYSVALILKSGEKIRTCNYIVNNPTLKKSLKPSVNVYPNPAKASAPIVVELSEMDDLTDAYILIYNQLGVQIDKISNLSPHNTLSLKKGFYHGVVICGSTKLTFKIIVNE